MLFRINLLVEIPEKSFTPTDKLVGEIKTVNYAIMGQIEKIQFDKTNWQVKSIHSQRVYGDNVVDSILE